MAAWTGQLSLAPRYPSYVCALVLTAGSAKSLSVPSWAKVVVFGASGGIDFYVSYGGTATIPSSDITDGTGCELNPVARIIEGVGSISIISSKSGVVTLSFYGGAS